MVIEGVVILLVQATGPDVLLKEGTVGRQKGRKEIRKAGGGQSAQSRDGSAVLIGGFLFLLSS
jgi:hypothetical protein